MYGFKKKTQRLADGGMIRGKGTGTSDSIKAKMPEGTYVMPADTTKGLGFGKPIDVRVSNGEFALPPKAVHAIGAQVLDTIKGATHAPTEPKGFTPRRMYLADGGLARGKRGTALKNGGMVKGYAAGGLIEDDKKPMLGAPQGFRTVAQGAQVLPGRPEVKTPSPLSPSLDPIGLNPAYSDTIARTKDTTRDNLFKPSMIVPQVNDAVNKAGSAAGSAMIDAYKNQYNNPADKAIAAVGDGVMNYAEVANTGVEPDNRTRIQDSIKPPATPVAALQNPGQPNPNPASVEPSGFKPQSYASRMTAEQDASFANTPAGKEVMSNGIVIEGRNKNGKANSFSGKNITELATGKGAGNLSVMDTSGLRASPYYQQAVQEMNQPQGFQPQNQVTVIGENGGFGFDKKDPAQARTEAIQMRVDDLRRAAGISAPTPKMIEAATAEYGAYDSVANNQLTNQTAENRTVADSANNMADRQSRDNQYGVQNMLAANQDARAGTQADYTNQKLGFEAQGLQRIEALRDVITNPKATAEERATAQEQFLILTNAGKNRYSNQRGEDVWVPEAGVFKNSGDRTLDEYTGKLIQQEGQQGKQPQMTREQALADLEKNAKNMTAQEQRDRVAEIRAMKE